jgi:tetratricopeptide (TPR) repeat protein
VSGTPEARPVAPGFWQRLFRRTPAAPEAAERPASIGRYRVVRLLGEGGMGRVYEAEDEVLGRRLAVKRLKSGDSTARRRFWREARAAARLSHPNVCPLYEVGEDREGLFLAMELLAGEPLSRRLERGPMSLAEAVALASGVLAALQALHAAGIVHRDLKPSNVFLTPHGARLLDFGLARQLPGDLVQAMGADSDPTLTHPDMLVGSPRYMAPEQILGRDVDGRTDLFAAGAVLYEALSGRPAFAGRTLVEVLSATLHDAPPPLDDELARLEPVIRRALAKDPAERFQKAEEMAEALREATIPPARAAATAAPPGGESRDVFAGRAEELAWLEERLAAALSGAGSVVFVTGERGAGKSALVGEFLRRVRARTEPVTIAAGRSMEPQGPGETFLPFLDAFGRLLSTRAREVAVELVRTWAPTIGIQMPAALVPDPDGSLHRRTAGATRDRLVREAGDFFEAAANLYPLVLLLEDVHWADPASIDLLCHLGRRVPRQRMLLLATYRPSAAEARNPPLTLGAVDLRTAGLAAELPLGPLSVPDVASWLEARFSPSRFPPGLAEALHARAEGLPVFVRSLVELLVARGEIRRAAGDWTLARPPGELDLEPSKDVKDLVRAQLAPLPPADRELLEAAAVVGRDFSSPVVAALAGGDPLLGEEGLLRLSRVHRVLECLGDEELPDGTLGTRYRFAHGLFRRVLYEDVVAPRRAQLHRRTAELLTRHWGEDAPMLAVRIAEHFELGRDAASAARFRTRAGDHAARRFAAAEAEEQYTCALRLLEKVPPAEGAGQEIALFRRRAVARHTQARFDGAILDYEAMLARARAARVPAAECDALSGLSNTLFFAQRLPEMAARAREGRAAAERHGSAHHVSEARGRVAQVLVMEGRLDEAAAELEAVIASARESGSKAALQVGLGYRGFVHYWQGAYAATEDDFAVAISLSEELGDGFETLAARMFLGMARANLGRMSEALADFEQGLALAERNGDSFWRPRLVSDQGWVHRELQAPERARELDARALQIALEHPSPWTPEADALINLCVDDVRSGHPDRAAGLLARLEVGARQGAWLRWLNELRLEAAAAEHWAARGDYDTAAARASRLRDLARPLRARNYGCAAERLLGRAALASGTGLEAAATRLAATLADLEAFPTPLEGWKSARVLGLLHERIGDRGAAGRAFALAAREVATIAAGTHDESLRGGFLASADVREVLERAGSGAIG